MASLNRSAQPAGKKPLPPLANNGKAPKTRELSSDIQSFSQLVNASRRPLPEETGDGSYVVQDKQTGLVEDLKHIGFQDVNTVVKLVRSKLSGDLLMDDKEMMMERVIQLAAALPDKSHNRQLLTNSLVSELWNSLDHPPQLFVGEQFQYRMPDGSFNNIHMPQLGAAGTTYARSVRSTIAAPTALPDPGVIFDSIMCRSDYKEHPNNSSSILWYWATVIIHDLFWTDQANPHISKTSSYLDLSPLYGSNQKMQDTIRTFRDGMLKVDSFADKRLIGMPPGVGVILVMFNRFHNHVASNLAAINESGRFTRPSASPDDADEKAKAAWKKYDNDLFQTARLITCGLYMNITLVDYVRNIVNLNRCNTTFTLDPRADAGIDAGIDAGTTDGVERGTGNVVSAEFSLLYRWHSCISAKDEKWIESLYEKLMGKPALEASVADFMRGFVQLDRSIPDEPADRVFGDFVRGPDGRFRDDDLAGCISDAIEDVAGAFGAQNVPRAMKPAEILGILRGRRWHLSGLNEFRRHFGLKPHATFEDINPDPAVADQLRHLYQHPDLVELYPGIVAEAAKPLMVPAVGIAATYTLSRVILSDAVCLIRGDRHYTIDYGPKQLTSWGFHEADYDMSVNHGCVFYKLFTRAFPNHFQQNSVYAHYPTVVPSENRRILESLGRADRFDFARPTAIPAQVDVTSYGAAKKVLGDAKTFRVAWDEAPTFQAGEGGGGQHASATTPVHSQLDGTADWTARVQAFYAETAEALLAAKTYRLAGVPQVDIVHDVGNIVPVHFAARMFGLPLKTAAHPRGVFSEQELYAAAAVILATVSSDFDPTASFPLRQAAQAACARLGPLVESRVKRSRPGLWDWLTGWAAGKKDPLAAYGEDLICELSKAGLSTHDIAWSQILPTAAALIPNQAQAFAQAVDFYLSPDGSKHIPAIHNIATQPSSKENDALLLGYAMEGARLSGTYGTYRKAAADTVITEDDGRRVPVRTGDRIFVSFISAARDPNAFPKPDQVNPRRPLDRYIGYNAGPQTSFGHDVGQVALAELFRVLFRHKNVRRVPGPQGELKKVAQPGGFSVYMTENWGSYFPFPVTMKVMWDE